MALAAAKGETLVPRHVAWRNAYRKERYLKYASDEDIKQRFWDLQFCNLTLSADSKITFHLDRYKSFVASRATHILEEASIRKWPYPGPLAFPSVDNFLTRLKDKHSQDLSWTNNISTDCLLRFSKQAYLQNVIEFGNFRICPATFYANKSFGSAIADDEMQFSINAKFQDMFTKHEIGEVRYAVKEGSDYYLMSFCNKLDLRLPLDFDADSLLIIREKKEFCRRIIRSLKEALGDSFEIVSSQVVYLDPYFESDEFKTLVRPNGTIEIWKAKHFRYMYQNEFRIAAKPKISTSNLGEPINFTIGNISDIAEIRAIK